MLRRSASWSEGMKAELRQHFSVGSPLLAASGAFVVTHCKEWIPEGERVDGKEDAEAAFARRD